MCRSAASEGAKGPEGWDCWDREEPLEPRAVGEMTENNDPRSKVNGYTRRTIGEGAGWAGVTIAVFETRS